MKIEKRMNEVFTFSRMNNHSATRIGIENRWYRITNYI